MKRLPVNYGSYTQKEGEFTFTPLRKEVRFLLGYRINIDGDTSGNISWSITFGTGDNKTNSAETGYIYRTVEKFTQALQELANPTS